MSDVMWAAALAGAAAGLGVAMPLGAIGALLLRESLVGGLRVGAAAAAGVATVDVSYCAIATATGAVFAGLVEEHRGAFVAGSGAVIVAIGVRQLIAGWRRPGPGAELEPGRSSARAAYARFVGLTAMNPMTLVYFVALGGAVTSAGGSSGAPVAFVAAVGMASLAWQLLLAAVGAVFRRAVGHRGMHGVAIAASLLVVGLGTGVLSEGVRMLTRPGS